MRMGIRVVMEIVENGNGDDFVGMGRNGNNKSFPHTSVVF